MIPSREEMYRALEERHGKELQKKLSGAAVAVCGLGGLGSNIAVSLARAGVGELLLIDFDTVDISNLNRQQYFPEQLGLPKTEALSETLRKIAPYCNIRSAQVKLNEENAPELLADVPFICEAFDRADQKEMLVGCILEKMPEKYLVAANIIGVLMLSGIAYAAIHIISNVGVNMKSQPQETQVLSQQPQRPTQSIEEITDSIPQTRIFENVPLDEVASELALYYNKVVDIQNAQAHDLRLYYKWERKDELESIVSDLNHFDHVNLVLEDDKLIVKP